MKRWMVSPAGEEHEENAWCSKLQACAAVEKKAETDAQQADPLDAAIVEAAIHFYRHDDTPSVQEMRAAVQAKLDATKPKTAEDVLTRHFVTDQPLSVRCSCGFSSVRYAGMVRHHLEQLREAGLLKEDTE